MARQQRRFGTIVALIPIVCLAAAVGAGLDSQHLDTRQVISQAVRTNTRDWNAQLRFSFDERDVKSKVDDLGKPTSQQSKTYQVLMIDGSPYNRSLSFDNEPLSRAQQKDEEQKLRQEIENRRNESASERKARVGKFQSLRADEHLLMQQLTDAFDFRLMGTEEVEGVSCYKFDATPKPNYRPPVEKARVLLGMRGQMWIDQQHFHWVKVRAEVTKPVTFGFFVARVKPGTEFKLEQMPVGNFWLPKYFVEKVNASVLGVYGYRSQLESFYSNYKDNTAGQQTVAALE